VAVAQSDVVSQLGPNGSVSNIIGEQSWSIMLELMVSLKESSVCVVDSKGKVFREAKTASEPEALCDLISMANTFYRRQIDKNSLTLVAFTTPPLPARAERPSCMHQHFVVQLIRLVEVSVQHHSVNALTRRIDEFP
jgi:hypothetical protein